MALDKRDTIPIPGPRALPIIGNALDVQGEVPIERIAALGGQYGEIFSLWLGGKRIHFVSSHALLNELCDENRFVKKTGGPLAQVRNGVHDGLFTANHGEENWGIAHRVLVPAFGPLPIHGMFHDMKSIAAQLVMKWCRFGESYKIPVTDDFTRLTLDTLALCAMDFRFNSFYAEEMHPFVSAMVNFLSYCAVRARRPPFLHSWYSADEAKFSENIKYMRDLSNDLVQTRRNHPKDTKDLLNAMVNGKDPKTGKAITDDSIIDNLITFLVAGHETTSGWLSYVFYCLLKNPDAYRKAQQEVDEVVGTESVTEDHLRKLPYITAVLRETGRLHSTAPAFSVSPRSETGEILAGKYHIPFGEVVGVILNNVHRDPAVYGDDAEMFKPERMLDENFNKLPPNSWKPFGNGERGCIGRGFAWQEMMLVMAMLLQYFNFSMDDPAYKLQTAFSLTIKPKDFYMKTTLREGWTARTIEQHLSGSLKVAKPTSATAADNGVKSNTAESKTPGKPFTILYGSNSGTCEVFAQTLAADARAHGFTATKVDTLDSAKGNLPTGEPVVIVTASYEGEPCDNAAHFFDWLKNNSEKITTQYAVFGCGHSDWKQTFHQVPKAIDRLLEKAGGQRLCEMGSANAANGDMLSEFQAWEDDSFWPALQKQFGEESDEKQPDGVPFGQNLTIEIFNKRASHLRSDVSEAKVISAKTLTSPGVGEKRHIEIQLPSEMTFRAGDYLAVLPLNPQETVHRVLKRFSLPWDAMLKISSRTGSTLPTDHPISAQNLFSAYLELSQPATKRNMTMLLSAAAQDPETTASLSALDADFANSVTEKRLSLLDLLEQHPTLALPLNAFVSSLISMRVRQYSISSSPLSDPSQLTLTYAVLNAPSPSGTRHIGVASNYMSSLQPGDIMHVATRPSHSSFRLPTDPANIPVIMIAAGAGLAPFRGFIQERAAQIGSGRKLAPARLYFGCKDPEKDDLYREEMDFWERMGAVQIHRSYSQKKELSGGYKHIHELFLAQKDELLELWEQGARVYVCGSRGLGESTKKACMEIARDKAKSSGRDPSDEDLEAWFDKIRNERYSTDVFA